MIDQDYLDLHKKYDKLREEYAKHLNEYSRLLHYHSTLIETLIDAFEKIPYHDNRKLKLVVMERLEGDSEYEKL